MNFYLLVSQIQGRACEHSYKLYTNEAFVDTRPVADKTSTIIVSVTQTAPCHHQGPYSRQCVTGLLPEIITPTDSLLISSEEAKGTHSSIWQVEYEQAAPGCRCQVRHT